MIKKAHTLRRVAGTFVFIAAIVVSQFSGVQFAHAVSTDVWTGTAGDNNLATANNWAGNAVPVSGDTLSFSAISGGATKTLTNNLGAGVSLAGIIINGGATASITSYTINTLKFATGATIVSTGTDTTLTVSGAVTSAGSLSISDVTGGALTFSSTINTVGDFTVDGTNITLAGTVTIGGNGLLTGEYVNGKSFSIGGALNVTGNLTIAGINVNVTNTVTVTGNLTVTLGLYNSEVYTVGGTLTLGTASFYGTIYLANGSAITGIATVVNGTFNQTAAAAITLGGLVVDNGASAQLSTAPSYPMTFGSGASTAYPSLVYNTYTYNSQTQTSVYENLAISSAVTLLNNLSVSASGDATSGSVSFTGAITYNGFTISKSLGSSGKLLVGGTEIKNAAIATTYTGNLPQTNFSVAESETATLTGTRGQAQVYTGGILKGTGTLASSLYVSYGGTVSPGNSPGTLTVLQTLSMNAGSIYQAELLNAASYDQLQVGAQYTGSGHAVSLGFTTSLPTLNLVLYPGYSIKKGDAFTIIDNKSTTAVSGTFAGLAEGTQFVVGGITFNITYVGGDGNDVIVTALSAGTDPKGPNTSVAETIMANPATILVLGIATAGFLGFIATRRRANR
ncbi:MAG: transporter [Candidatus Saccharibacteria bacterium]|nr:transporter [Candidatus Saccharibacteria bacterium]